MRKHRCLPSIPLVLAVLVLSAPVVFAFTGSSWKHLASKHFVVSYDDRTAVIAPRAAAISEEIFDQLSGYFGYGRLGAISVVLSDHSDDPNGFSAARDPVVSIDARKAQNLFRGETDWLRTVLSHELSHLFSLNVLNPPIVLGTSLSVSSSAENFSGTAQQYWGVNAVPEWFVEGIAQLGSYHFKADSRDPIREMVLRDAFLNDALLSLSEMARFEGTSLDYEKVYNQGFSFVLFLEEKYSSVALQRLCALVKSQGLLRALQTSYDKPAEALYEEWKEDLSRRWSSTVGGEAGQRIVRRDDLMGLEMASVRSGEYVIANWGNEYGLFSLFRRSGDGRYLEVSHDTGLVLKEDPATGEVWFNKKVYDYGTGSDTYDVFRITKNGIAVRVTSGARCLAFDARESHLMYARYSYGMTQIVQRKPDGSERIFYQMPPEDAVYSLSMVSRDTAVLTAGSGDLVRLAVFADGKMQYLWPHQEVLDATAAGDNRIVFSSTRSGHPQIYWADLAKDARSWHQVTEVAGGARYVSLEGGGSSSRLSFSVFENGGYHRYSLDDPFPASQRVEISDTALESPPDTPSTASDADFARTFGNPVLGAPTFSVQLDAERDRDGTETVTTPVVSVGASSAIYNAPGNLELSISGSVFSPILPDTPLVPDVAAAVTGWLDIWQLRNAVQYSVETLSYYMGPGDTFTFVFNDLYAQSQYQLGIHSGLTAHYDFSWVGGGGSPSTIYYEAHSVGIQWQYGENPRSLFDPANLGQPFVGLFAGASAKYQSYPTPGAFNPSTYDLTPRWSSAFELSTRLRSLLLESRLSLDLQGGGFYYLAVPNAALPSPSLQPSVGREGFFSGYPAGYARINGMAWASLGVLANPFVEKRRKVEWYQRMSLGAKVEAGVVQCFSSGLALGFPVSLEASLRASFYLSPNRESSAYVKVGVPLNDFLDRIVLPFQIFAGYSY